MTESGWSRFGYGSWSDLAWVRAQLAAGADPNTLVRGNGRPLHHAAREGSAEVVAELAALVDDVDAVGDGHTALWLAVQAGRPANARALVAAGADPERPMMAGWSPARLSLAGATPDLFETSAALTDAEVSAVAEARELIDALAAIDGDGMSLCCVAGIDAAEAVRRLDAAAVQESIAAEDMWDATDDESMRTLGVTDVPGGCVVSQPWAYGASMPLVALLLSAGTTCYGMYANPKSGNQGASVHDGAITGWDLHPGGGWSAADATATEILRDFLYQHHAVAYCCAYAGVRPAGARPFTDPDRWIRLPVRDWWATSAS
ncbi:ankyrin repeat domain-containing protein [Paractinoplanes lichenicola]|uniref:Ankyrin repeat domain-containing protein n=1 Tax=Paractinoplanes lichenicola TaxID=2802976 RepID=A0ABS1VYV5_9ACTN|nr:ankyrin repeat domain-containing protein [Actinoplanes lichenicola]MBL7259629.1 ankyrin repeat domain-containing protein [Actinoplanes lichenicola]